jgi:hypothetical protein
VRWHALYLISKGAVAADAARRTGQASFWITGLTQRYNREGAAAVARKQSTRPSHPAKVDQKLSKELAKALHTSAPDGGLWIAPKVAPWITEKSGKKFITRPPSVPCVGSASACKCHARKQAAGVRLRASRVQKKIGLEAQALQKAYPTEAVEVGR